jgi:hypothetical protein
MRNRRIFLVPFAAALLWVPSAARADLSGSFVEPVTVIHEISINAGRKFYGWAVSELHDIDSDGVQDILTGSILLDKRAGQANVYSGQTGDPIFTFPGEPGDLLSYSVADAGDTSGDGVTDILIGSPFRRRWGPDPQVRRRGRGRLLRQRRGQRWRRKRRWARRCPHRGGEERRSRCGCGTGIYLLWPRPFAHPDAEGRGRGRPVRHRHRLDARRDRRRRSRSDRRGPGRGVGPGRRDLPVLRDERNPRVGDQA